MLTHQHERSACHPRQRDFSSTGSRYEDPEASEFLPLGRTSRPCSQVSLAQGNEWLSSRASSKVDVYYPVSCLPKTPLSQQPPARGDGLLTATITVLNVKEEWQKAVKEADRSLPWQTPSPFSLEGDSIGGNFGVALSI